jgi:hypothetical protein
MKRILVATLSTLVLSASIAPAAHAIRPELLPQSNYPSASAEKVTPNLPQETSLEASQKPSMMPAQEAAAKTQLESEKDFYYFERLYKEKYGS